MWYVELCHDGIWRPTLLYYCTEPSWFWTREAAQAECDKRNAETIKKEGK